MTWHQGTHYLFLNSVRYRKMSPGIPGRGVSEVERHIMDKGYGGRNLVAGSLEAWKMYRVLLNRVDTSTAPDIEWPVNPV